MNEFNLNDLLVKDLAINQNDVKKILDNYEYSTNKIKKLKKEISDLFPLEFAENICIFLVGSYGRLEASKNSDLDCIFIYKNSQTKIDKSEICKSVFQIAEKNGIKKIPGDTGTFKEFIQLETLLKNIGGFKDTNKDLTRRILILTESYPLYNDNLCKEVLLAIFNKYTEKAKQSDKEPRELINELVRYYRTITLDYKYKIEEAKKSWGVRNFKLRHSRKLLFFTSISIIFTSINILKNNNDYNDKYDYILENINRPPIIKLGQVLIENERALYREPFIFYNKFLECLSDEKNIKELGALDYNKRSESEIFLELKSNSDKFDKSLKDLIKSIDDWDDLFYRYVVF
ncbi:MAG: nucleotidyltransferase domain-containing protein [Spirochaetes bacterium]|nr:nucleotidyltransferase domain-containing protein [Spirochaetota bacterium]